MSSEIIKKHYSTTQEILAQIAGIIFIIPLAPFICRFIPPVFVGSFNIDLIISVVVSIVIVRLMQWLIKPMILPALLLVFGLFAYNQANNNHYTFQNVASDYKTLVSQYWLMREQKQTDQLSFNPHLFENVEERTSRLITEKVQYKDSVVRNFSRPMGTY